MRTTVSAPGARVRAAPGLVWAALAAAAAACGEAAPGPAGPGPEDERERGLVCTVSSAELAFALVPEAILALSDPPLVDPGHPDATYVQDDDRVVGLSFGGAPLAVPLNVLRFHEVVNLTGAEDRLAVTFCPLTGSSLVFDRSRVGGELGVSGILRHNNLVMYDRADDATFFSQMDGGAPICGPGVGARAPLRPVPSVELRWDAWRALHPDTKVLSERTGLGTFYRVNPHAEYEQVDNPFLLFPEPIDHRRPPKERVLGLPAGGDGGTALPFGELARRARRAVTLRQGDAVVFWDGSAEAATAFRTELDGARLSFRASEVGFEDLETGSTWRLDGLAVAGALSGRRLEPIPDAYVSFWFAWAAFQPETVVWRGDAR